MSVYVDRLFPELGPMRMCHLLADTTEELLAMADRIGLDRRYIQHAGTYREHFDVSLSERVLALEAGAREITRKELVEFLQVRRSALLNVREETL